VSQTVTEVEDLLSIFSTSGSSTSSASSDPSTGILNAVYGQNNSSNGSSNTSDPTTALLESQYGASGVNVYA
jgi:hypothetical protein